MIRARVLILALLASAAPTAFAQLDSFPVELEANRKPSIVTNGNCFIKGGRILTVTKGVIEDGSILVLNGRIAAIGKGLVPPPGVQVIDARGKTVTPGIVDAHSHRASDATNEGTVSITSECRIFDVLNSKNRNVWLALASGETSGVVLHGSANSIGGQSLVVKFKYGRPFDQMVVPYAPRMIKFALGENVTQSGSQGQQNRPLRFPRTRMGVQALYRRAFQEAKEYIAEWDAYEKSRSANPLAVPPRRDLRLETLADILKRKIWVQCHSYRADEMLMMVRLSQEFGFKIGALQHALEAYKIAPELAKAGIGVSVFAESWGYKFEAYDAIPYNASMCAKAGVVVSINTDSLGGTVAIAQDAGKVMRYGSMSETDALRMLTINPAKQIGIDSRTGSLEVGKDADIAVWDGNPLSMYAKCNTTIVDGDVLFQRRDAFGIDGKSTIKNDLHLTQPQPIPSIPANAKVVALVGAIIHPVSGPTIKGGTILIEGDKIKAIGQKVNIPAGAVVVNLEGRHIYPGLLDGYTGLGLTEISGFGQLTDASENGDLNSDLIALTAVNVQSEFIPVARNMGVVGVLTAPQGGTFSGQASFMHTFGYTSESTGIKPVVGTVVASGGGTPFFNAIDLCCGNDERFAAQGLEAGAYFNDDEHADNAMAGGQGQGPRGNRPSPNDSLKGPSETLGKVREYRAARLKDPKLPKSLPMEALLPYLDGKLPFFIKAQNAASIRNAVQWAKDQKVKIILVGARDAWKETALLKSAGVPVLLKPAGESTLPGERPINDWDPYDTNYVIPYLLAKAGVKFGFGSDNNEDTMALPFRIGQACAYGLSKDDAWKAATLWTAQILGVDSQLGSLEPGKLASLIVTTGDPLDSDGRVDMVMIAGKPAPMTSKFTRLRDQYMQRLQK